MRKFIFLGVVGGLAQFALVGYVAFSEPSGATLLTEDPVRRSAADGAARQNEGGPPGKDQPGAAPERARLSASAAPVVMAAPAKDTASFVRATASLAAPALPPSTEQPANPSPANAPPGTSPATASPTTVQPSRPAVPGPSEASSSADSKPGPSVVSVPVNLSLAPVEDLIRSVFGIHGDKAVQVARCESELETTARNGSFLGLFQLGDDERVAFGHGQDALTQIKAAYDLFLSRGWQPWTCA
ncbi:MAG: hypothetical protein ACT4OM_13615 [Actinomycetota bacterium]